MIKNVNPNLPVQQVQPQTNQTLPREAEVIRNSASMYGVRVDIGFDERTAFFPPVCLNKILSLTHEEFAELRAERFEAIAERNQRTPEVQREAQAEIQNTEREVSGTSQASSVLYAENAEYLIRVGEVQDKTLQSITQTL